MNYLAHFYIDRKTNNPYYNAGLLLPDISRDFVKSYKEDRVQPGHREHHNLHQGCRQHYTSDKHFHGSGFFDAHQDAFNRLVKNAALSDQVDRRWFIAHVLFELMLDRMIVKHHPEIVDDFYLAMDEINHGILKDYLLAFGARNPEAFLIRFGHFCAVRYIYLYADTNKLVYSLSRIMMRAGLKEPQGNDWLVLESLCNEAESLYFSNPEKTLSELKQIFT